MGHHEKNRNGFTIVELIVVIVVIAILASIVFLGYREISKNAYNTQVIAGVSAYYQAINAYKLSEHEYPTTEREEDGEQIAMTCLGVGYQDEHCGRVTGVEVYEDDLFNSQLNAFLKTDTKPVSNLLIPVPGESYRGAVYGIDSTSASSTGYGRVIEYALHGQNADCTLTKAWAYSTSSGSTACEILLEEVEF